MRLMRPAGVRAAVASLEHVGGGLDLCWDGDGGGHADVDGGGEGEEGGGTHLGWAVMTGGGWC